MLLALTKDWNYDHQMQFGLGVMDLRMAPTNVDEDENSKDPAFFTYIQRMQSMLRPNFFEASAWLWIHDSDVRAQQSSNFEKQFKLEYESTYFLYRSSRNEHLNDTKTRGPPVAMYLFFLLNRGDDRASHLRHSVKASSDVPYYLDVGEVQRGEVPRTPQQAKNGVLPRAHEAVL